MAFTFPVGSNSIIMVKHIVKSKYERLYSWGSYWTTPIVPTQEQLDSFSNELHADVGGQWRDLADIDSKMVETQVDFRNVEDVQVESFTQDDIAGLKGGVLDDATAELEGLPTYAALIIQKVTGKHGRSKRGRFFIPLISETVQHDGIIDDLNVPACRELADIFQTDREIGGDLAHARHWDRKNNKLEVITHTYPLDVLGTRRDRKLGRKGVRLL